jgi:hypothetical protein
MKRIKYCILQQHRFFSDEFHHDNSFIICVFTLTQENNNKNKIASVTATSSITLDDIVSLFYVKDVNFIFMIDSSVVKTKSIDKKFIIRAPLEQIINFILIKRSQFKNNGLGLFFKRSVFIIKDVSWKDVIDTFKKNDIYITGGHNTKRHILSTTQYRLSIISHHLGINYDTIAKNYHYNSSLLINQINAKREIHTLSTCKNTLARLKGNEDFTYGVEEIYLNKFSNDCRLKFLNEIHKYNSAAPNGAAKRKYSRVSQKTTSCGEELVSYTKQTIYSKDSPLIYN